MSLGNIVRYSFAGKRNFSPVAGVLKENIPSKTSITSVIESTVSSQPIPHPDTDWSEEVVGSPSSAVRLATGQRSAHYHAAYSQ